MCWGQKVNKNIYFAASWTLLRGVAPRSYAPDNLHYGEVFKVIWQLLALEKNVCINSWGADVPITARSKIVYYS
jgi:hypothetical protein